MRTLLTLMFFPLLLPFWIIRACSGIFSFLGAVSLGFFSGLFHNRF